MMKFAALAIVALFTTETQAVQVSTESKLQMRAQIDSAIDSYLNADESSGAEAEWGFLKNIVNIDRFFDSGVKAWALTSGAQIWRHQDKDLQIWIGNLEAKYADSIQWSLQDKALTNNILLSWKAPRCHYYI